MVVKGEDSVELACIAMSGPRPLMARYSLRSKIRSLSEFCERDGGVTPIEILLQFPGGQFRRSTTLPSGEVLKGETNPLW